MTKKDILEIKRRFKKGECTFTKLRGCYVNSQKEIILHINETFLNLIDEEFFKYLEIAKKTLSGTIGNNLLELEFTKEETQPGGKQQFLLGLRDSKLKNDALLERLYELIIENYDYTGNYIIILFHDAYDVVTKTNDNNKIDESEEVYEYLLCAICPVELTKPGLGYIEEEQRIGARIRDWVVSVPETGFVFPAFSERSSDVNSVIYYTKNTKEPQQEFMLTGLGCEPKRTAFEEKKTFQSILKSVISAEEDDGNEIIMNIQEAINNIVIEHKNIYEKEPVLLTESTLKNVISESGVSEDVAIKLEKLCLDEFGDIPPIAENLIDNKALEENYKKKKEQKLQKEVVDLKQKLEETIEKNISKNENNDDIKSTVATDKNFDIVLNVNPIKIPEIKTQLIDGKKYIMIPIEENEQASINGINTDI